MATSGTYSFNPSLGEITIYAANLCGLRGTAILAEHMESARMAANMLLGRWSSQTPNLWSVDLQTVSLVQGTASYSVPDNTVAILDAYVTIGTGAAAINRILMPISRSEYASYSAPQQEGFPTVFWFDRLLSPTVTLYLVPNGQQVSLSYYRVRQSMDAGFSNGQQVEIPYYWLESLAYGMAFRLATIWAPDKAPGLKLMADEAYTFASTQNTESSNFYVSPQISGYFQV